MIHSKLINSTILVGLVSLGVVTTSHADNVRPNFQSIYDKSLPVLPSPADISSDDVGKAFKVKGGKRNGTDLLVAYAGLAHSGHLLVSAETEHILEDGYNFTAASFFCQSIGDGWRLPDRFEIPLVSTVLDVMDTDYLPGQYWTTTPAPCVTCVDESSFVMTYDIYSGNIGNTYAVPLVIENVICVKTH